MKNELKLLKNELRITPGASKIDPGGSPIDPGGPLRKNMHKKGVGPGWEPSPGGPQGTPNGAKKHQNLQNIEQNSKKS